MENIEILKQEANESRNEVMSLLVTIGGIPHYSNVGKLADAIIDAASKKVFLEMALKPLKDEGQEPWIEWFGRPGDAPEIDMDGSISIRMRAGDEYHDCPAWCIQWVTYGEPQDIVAYRVNPTGKEGE